MTNDEEAINLAYEQINYYRNMPNHVKAVSIKLKTGFENYQVVNPFPALNTNGRSNLPFTIL